ncbi:uncharacterized protein UMAG_02131 [Mycosarcoma maydis]|uniref:Uncharacterized protein n=1 Tax=Mycosarcoma maydis TaxID=5270 RepID=A0A0D1E141_MYCMD|nr:uncharacterized protein UMAG_02131 [Ustilago maydis 521]KIS69596.1 hypothetical protein UMAG_02131 [Ustilago maydis 521]|eukprot:XP_011388488.1 hypothetical protein UMAG_02131 [Ustilago maydis 521]
MTPSSHGMRLQLTSMPPEILHLIAQAYIGDLNLSSNNVASVLSACSLFRDLFLPKLYASITIHSVSQLSRFVSPSSGARVYSPQYTLDSLIINIAGVPGGGDGTWAPTVAGMSRSRDRLLLASQALALCCQVRNVSLEFFSIRHSEILTSDEFRWTEAKAFEDAVKGLSRVRKFRWVPPRCDANAIIGLSIVIVDQVIPSLAKGLCGCHELETLELWNTMLPESGGADLAQSLIRITHQRKRQGVDRPLELNLRSVTGLDPKTVSDLALSRPPIKINIADGFVGSIWGARIDKHAVQECMRATLSPTASTTSSNTASPTLSETSNIDTSRATTPEMLIHDTLAKASENIRIIELQGGIAGSRILAH